jgi:uncharacterized protein (TIGR00369 family)
VTDSNPCLTRYDHAPVGNLIGMEIEPHRTLGEAKVYLNVDERHHNPMGTVHGGILALLADTAMGVAFGRTLDENQTFGTIDIRVDFVRPVGNTRLTAVGTMVKRGARVGFLKAEIFTQSGRLVSTANCTCLVISPS